MEQQQSAEHVKFNVILFPFRLLLCFACLAKNERRRSIKFYDAVYLRGVSNQMYCISINNIKYISLPSFFLSLSLSFSLFLSPSIFFEFIKCIFLLIFLCFVQIFDLFWGFVCVCVCVCGKCSS